MRKVLDRWRCQGRLTCGYWLPAPQGKKGSWRPGWIGNWCSIFRLFEWRVCGSGSAAWLWGRCSRQEQQVSVGCLGQQMNLLLRSPKEWISHCSELRVAVACKLTLRMWRQGWFIFNRKKPPPHLGALLLTSSTKHDPVLTVALVLGLWLGLLLVCWGLLFWNVYFAPCL